MKNHERNIQQDINDLSDLTQYYSLYRSALTLVHIDPNKLSAEKRGNYDKTMLSFKRAAFLTPYELARPAYEVMANHGLIERRWLYDRDSSWAAENNLKGNLRPNELESKLFEARMEEVNRLRAVAPAILEDCHKSSDKTSDRAILAGALEKMQSGENNMQEVLMENEEATAFRLGVDLSLMQWFWLNEIGGK